MKFFANALKKSLTGLFTVVLAVSGGTAAHAQILLINDSDPSNVTITFVSGGVSLANTSGLIAEGVDLLTFFRPFGVGPFPDLPVVSSTLTTGDGSAGPIFTQASGDDVTIDPGDSDLNLYHNNSLDQISFTTGVTAFSGTLTLNLSQSPFADNLPKPGATGAVMLGFSEDRGATIGQWEVVSAPEPSTWALLLGSIALLPLVRRFRRA